MVPVVLVLGLKPTATKRAAAEWTVPDRPLATAVRLGRQPHSPADCVSIRRTHGVAWCPETRRVRHPSRFCERGGLLHRCERRVVAQEQVNIFRRLSGTHVNNQHRQPPSGGEWTAQYARVSECEDCWSRCGRVAVLRLEVDGAKWMNLDRPGNGGRVTLRSQCYSGVFYRVLCLKFTHIFKTEVLHPIVYIAG